MDFAFTPEQEERRRGVVEFARELTADVAERDADSRFERKNWRKCAEAGLLGSFMPEKYGGLGLDVVTSIYMLEGFGYGCPDNGLSLALNGQMWSVQEPLLQFGTEAQKLRYLPGLASGEFLGAHGMTEPGSGSDAYSLATRATAVDGGYRLTGHKTLVGLAPECDVALIFATTDPSLGEWGVSAFVVEADTPGFTRGKADTKMGLRTAPLGDLFLDDCFVPDSALLGPVGAGVSIFTNSMEWERSFIFASHVGAMERQLEEAVEYARTRHQFDKPIGSFQSVSNRIADMKVRLDAAKLLLYRVAWLKQNGRPARVESAIAKLYLSEAFVESSLAAIRTHGGRGYLSGYEVERDLRDAIGGVIYSGTSDIQRQVIARLLGL